MIGHALKLATRSELSRDQWLQLRERGIGGSDAASVVGQSRYKSRQRLWAEKTGAMEPRTVGEAAEWGNLLEPVVRQRFANCHPELQVREVNAVLAHPQHAFMLGNVDGVAIGEHGPALVEVKTAGLYAGRGFEEGMIPGEYWWQVQHYLSVLGPDFRVAYVPVLIGGQRYEERTIYRDDDAIKQLEDEEAAFWWHVQQKMEPAPDDSPDTAEYLAEKYNTAVSKTVRLGDAMAPVLGKLMALRQQIKELEREKESLENRVKAQLGEANKGVAGEYSVSWSGITSKRVDLTLLKDLHPDIAEECSKETHYRRFTVSGGK